MTSEDEIDVVKIILFIWRGKWLLCVSVAFFLLIGSGYLGVRDRIYISQINALFDNKPPFATNAQINLDFQKMYFSRQRFEDWKKARENAALKFNDLIGPEDASVSFFAARRNDKLVEFSVKRKEIILQAKTTRPANLEEILDYTVSIGEQLNSHYRKSTEINIKTVNKRIKDALALDQGLDMDYFFGKLLEIDKYNLRANDGANLFRFSRPNAPKPTGLPNHLILFFCGICGGFVGLAILVMHSIIVWFRSELEARS